MKQIKLYSKRRLQRDLFLYGSFYLIDIGIFTVRLNPTKIITGCNGMSFEHNERYGMIRKLNCQKMEELYNNGKGLDYNFK